MLTVSIRNPRRRHSYRLQRRLQLKVKDAFRIILTLTWIGGAAASAHAQTAAPQHKHYETPAGYDAAPTPGKPLAPRLQNLGVHTFPVSTKVERAQLFINQGVNLAYAFNHAEAARAFAEAARLDPDLAMAYWGHALVLGPNINATMTPEDEPKALRAGAEGVVDEEQGVAARAGLHRRRGRALHRQARGSRHGQSRVCRGDAQRRRARFPTTSMRARCSPNR